MPLPSHFTEYFLYLHYFGNHQQKAITSLFDKWDDFNFNMENVSFLLWHKHCKFFSIIKNINLWFIKTNIIIQYQYHLKYHLKYIWIPFIVLLIAIPLSLFAQKRLWQTWQAKTNNIYFSIWFSYAMQIYCNCLWRI